MAEAETPVYSTLNVGSLAGTGNLSIDVDVTNVGGNARYNDKINITDGSSNSATLNLSAINVQNKTATFTVDDYDNYVNYVTGENSGITYKLNGYEDGSPSAQITTASYEGQQGRKYIFTLGADGFLNMSVVNYDMTLTQYI